MEYTKLFSGNIVMSADVAAKAEEELKETPDRKASALQELRDLLRDNGSGTTRKQQISEYFDDKSDDFLCRFLRVKKYDVQKAYESLESHLKFREKYPALTTDVTLDSVRSTLDKGYPGVLPTRDNQGRVVFLFSIGSWNSREFPFDEVMRAYVYLFERLLESVENQVSGFVLVENFRHYSISQALSLRPSDLRKMVDMLQGAFPVRCKGIHFIYQPWYFTWTYALVRPFLKQKIADRVHVHGWNLESFHKAVEPHTLPPDFGGSGPEFSSVDMIRALEDL